MLEILDMVGGKIFVLNKESKDLMSTKPFPGTLQQQEFLSDCLLRLIEKASIKYSSHFCSYNALKWLLNDNVWENIKSSYFMFYVWQK